MKKAFKNILAVFFCLMMITATASSASAIGKPTVKVKSVTYNSVTIYWTAVSGADYYQVQRTTDGKNWTNLNTSLKATTYTDAKSLTTGKSYGYRVRAVDKSLLGRLTYSAWTGMVVGKPLPAKVTGLKVKASNNTTVQLTWTKVAGANGYTVQYLSGNKWKTYKSTTSNVLNVTGLALGKTYSFRVAAYRTVSKKAVYGPVSATLKAGPTLNAPTTVVLSALNASALQIRWSTSAGAKGYEIYRADTKKWINCGTKTYATISGLKAGTKYSFIVRAYSGSFKGKQTATYTFQTVAAAPTGLKVTDATDKSITVSWNKVTGAAGYQVQKSTDNKNWSNVTASTTATKVTASGLKGNTKYYFRVRAFIKNSNVYKIAATTYGAFSSVVNYTTVISAPTVTATSPNATTIKLDWAAVSGAKSYMIEKYDSQVAKWLTYDFSSKKWTAPESLKNTSVTTTTARTFSDAENSSRAEVYRVRGIDAAGKKGTLSANINGCTSDIAVNYTDTFYNVRQLITWNNIEGATVYKVYSRLPFSTSSPYTEYKLSSAAKKGTKYSGYIYLAPNSINAIRVYAYDANGTYLGAATNWINLSINDISMKTSGLEGVSAANSQLLYVARAINNTKAYNGDIALKNNSTVSYEITYLKLPAILSILLGGPIDGVCDTPKEIANLFSKIDDSADSPTSSSETYNYTINFKEGYGVNEEGRTVSLRSQIEPSANSNQAAYLYFKQQFNKDSYQRWQDGIKNVKTTKNSDGGYTISFTIKQEIKTSTYHSGFISTFDAADFGAADGFDVKDLRVGETNITAVIDAEGILKSYKATSPYVANFAASFTATEDSDDGNISAGDSFSMEMGIKGNTNINYTFTR